MKNTLIWGVLLLVFAVALIAAVSFANTTRPLAFETLRYESTSDKVAGVVLVEVQQDEHGQIKSFKVRAFEKAYEMSEPDLSKISKISSDFPFRNYDGITVGINSGIFGRTLLIKLTRGGARTWVTLTPEGKFEIRSIS